MTEEKDLLLKYLCMALPYGVKILHEGWNFEWDDELSTVERVVGIDENFIYTKVIDTHNGEEYRDDKWPVDTFDDKPYLRPMSSMTMEDLQNLSNEIGLGVAFDNEKYELWLKGHTTILDNSLAINWLLEHHFDFMGLIPKGLAIEVTEENNPYKE